jgi:pilus assembly protein CpaE
VARGSVIAVFGARSDVGVSTLASSLAITLLSFGLGRVALAEVDPRTPRARGEAARTASASRTAESAHEPPPAERVTIAGSDAALARGADDVWTFAPLHRRTPPLADAKAVNVALDAMRARFGVIVAELEHQVNERTLAAFDAADRIVMVTQGSVPSLRGTQRVLRLCRRLNYPDEKVCVVVNCYDAPGSLPVADIASILKREIYWRVASGQSVDARGLAEKLLSETKRLES